MARGYLWRILTSNYVPDPSEEELFYTWALGRNHKEITHAADVIERWNILHKDILELHLGGLIQEDIQKMVNIWKNHLVNQSTESSSQLYPS